MVIGLKHKLGVFIIWASLNYKHFSLNNKESKSIRFIKVFEANIDGIAPDPQHWTDNMMICLTTTIIRIEPPLKVIPL